MVQNYNQQPQRQNAESSGMGVVLGILLAVVIAVGAYFFIQNRDTDTTGLEPAAGTTALESSSTTGMAPDESGTTAPAPNTNAAPQQ